MRAFCALGALALLFVPALTIADEAGDARARELVEKHVQPLLDAERVVGGVVGILRRDKTVFVGFGEYERGGGSAPAQDTIYEIGSITKVFTGTLLADMSLRGEVALDDPLQDLLPGGVTAPQKGDTPITLTHLATHSSGLPRLPDNLDVEANLSDPYKNYGGRLLAEFLGSYKPTREPGKSEYSNLGMGLLGRVLARRADKPYEELIIERIAEPLGMTDTRITPTDEQFSRFAPPYRGDLEPDHRWHFDCLAGCGAIRSTAPDLLKFANAAIEGGDQPVNQALELAFKKAANFDGGRGIGLGWMIAGDGVTRWHNGQTGGYAGALFIVPPAKTAVVLLTNTGCSDATTVCEKIVQATLGMKVEPIKFDAEVAVEEATLKRYVGTYQLAPGAVIDITLDDGQLMAQLTGQDAYAIYPKSDTRFFYKIVPAEISFDTDGEGNVKKLTLHQNGRDMPAPRK